MAIRFVLNGKACTEASVAPSMTVLDYLREVKGLKGTKEGCAEGDCGACTVVIKDAGDGGSGVAAVNSCLILVPQLDGQSVLTVEGISGDDGLHPVQRAMVENHGTQCGFCTPGFVMALYAMGKSEERVDLETVHDALAGNLCRCTGYRPIVDAALRLVPQPGDEKADSLQSSPPTNAALATYEFGDQRFHIPKSLDQLLDLRSRFPKAHLLGGATDLGILASRDREQFAEVIWTRRVEELSRIRLDGPVLTIGAAVTYAAALPVIDEQVPELASLIRRIGSRQIRNLGTLGGNVCTASPIGDTLPCLLALGATMTVRSIRGSRSIAADDFFTGYRLTALAPDEVLESISLSLPGPATTFKTYKISKRFDQDISAVIGAFSLTLNGETITAVRVAFGGMAARPLRARRCEEALLGAALSPATIAAAVAALERDFDPITDFRASAPYRRRVAGNLLWRLRAEIANPALATQVMAL